jgi:hypothetical protein
MRLITEQGGSLSSTGEEKKSLAGPPVKEEQDADLNRLYLPPGGSDGS